MDASGGGAVPKGVSEERAPERVTTPEGRYRILLRSFPRSAIILFDRELRFVLVDGPEVGATGYSKAAMEGRTVYEALPPDFVSLVEANMLRVLGGEEFSAELPFQDRYYRYDYVPVRDDAGDVPYGLIVATNVTDRRAIETELRRTTDRFQKIFRVTPDPLLVTTLSDGTILETNQAFIDVFGWSREEVLGSNTLALGMWIDLTRRVELTKLLRSSGKLDALELPFRSKDGVVRDFLVTLAKLELEGEPCAYVAFRDQTEKNRAVRALELSEARLRGLVEATFEGIAVTHAGKILDANDQLASMYGKKREEIIGHDVMELIAPESMELVRTRMRERDDRAYEHVALRGDGSRFPVEVRGRHAVIQGTPVRVTAIRDMTQRKKDESVRERLITELSARNAEMEQFTYTVSHDLKSPLVTINGFLGALERDIELGDGERIKSDMQRIASAASKMMRLLNDLLELSRVGRVTLGTERVDLGDVVTEALELVSGHLAAHGARVVVEKLPAVVGSRVRLLQVFQNLIENALKYMGAQPNPLVEIGTRPDETGLVCFVRDNGIGVKPAHAERIFGLFEKLDPKSEGTGLGLALVRRIIEYHGGKVSVESDGMHGSTFVLWFPREPSPTVIHREAR
ncbi:MAG TPA: PAS domain S-box protein [Polyangiaceae bacterium]|nr:PAS domain S-box protein [Polyangiaceae bacterium]